MAVAALKVAYRVDGNEVLGSLYLMVGVTGFVVVGVMLGQGLLRWRVLRGAEEAGEGCHAAGDGILISGALAVMDGCAGWGAAVADTPLRVVGRGGFSSPQGQQSER